MLKWITILVIVLLVTWFCLAMCKAAKNGDRMMGINDEDEDVKVWKN